MKILSNIVGALIGITFIFAFFVICIALAMGLTVVVLGI